MVQTFAHVLLAALLALVTATAAHAAVPNPTVIGPVRASAAPGSPTRDCPWMSTMHDLAAVGHARGRAGLAQQHEALEPGALRHARRHGRWSRGIWRGTRWSGTLTRANRFEPGAVVARLGAGAVERDSGHPCDSAMCVDHAGLSPSSCHSPARRPAYCAGDPLQRGLSALEAQDRLMARLLLSEGAAIGLLYEPWTQLIGLAAGAVT